jgi:hypothetical protein
MISHTKQALISEGFDVFGTPELKYYAFDWDDNIMHMPTKIMVLDDKGSEVVMSTEDFAKYRGIIGKENFPYEGTTIVDYAQNPFRNFRTEGDRQFIIDSMKGKPGPVWSDFVEAINNGSIFSIITARGHNPNTIKQAIYNMIISNHNGINKDLLLKNLKKYRKVSGNRINTRDLINYYMDLNKYYPVSYGSENSAASPEELKVKALQEFIDYVKRHAKKLKKKLYLKDNVKGTFTPTIGFSDDDIRNLEKIKQEFIKEPILKTYSTASGKKTRF